MMVTLVDNGTCAEFSIGETGVVMGSDIPTKIYYSLFGGSEDEVEWWGNLYSDQPFVSRTAKVLANIVISSGSVRAVERSVREDCRWLVETKQITTLDVAVVVDTAESIKIIVYYDDKKYEVPYEL